jgi:hypothetical protein
MVVRRVRRPFAVTENDEYVEASCRVDADVDSTHESRLGVVFRTAPRLTRHESEGDRRPHSLRHPIPWTAVTVRHAQLGIVHPDLAVSHEQRGCRPELDPR